ncbi:barstar family protein [Yersinia alsatica]|uniref:barstar family protein n=1 Tax=Yersinia alsatica TaxID=2890317 RepID=UPI00119FB78E|nr:barstar family protein [Yersinia alsatica]
MSFGEVILDGANILTEADFHIIMSESLCFGPYYGRNLNALWDRLSSDVERPVKIIWLNSELSRELLGEYFDEIIQVFEKTKQQDLKFNWDEKFDYLLN